jgi:hypothetical protein
LAFDKRHYTEGGCDLFSRSIGLDSIEESTSEDCESESEAVGSLDLCNSNPHGLLMLKAGYLRDPERTSNTRKTGAIEMVCTLYRRQKDHTRPTAPRFDAVSRLLHQS